MDTVQSLPPPTVSSLSHLNQRVCGQPTELTITCQFTDGGEQLAYTVVLSNSVIASALWNGMSALWNGMFAMVSPMSLGEVTMTVTALDQIGVSTSERNLTVGDGELKSLATKSLAGFGRVLLASV